MATFQKELYLKELHIPPKKKRTEKKRKEPKRKEKEEDRKSGKKRNRERKGTKGLTLFISDQSCLGSRPSDLSAERVADVTAHFICSYKAKHSLSVC